MIILYDTKHGTTEEIVRNIMEGIQRTGKEDVIMKKINEIGGDWKKHNTICVASPIYFRSPMQSISQFIKKNKEQFTNKITFIIVVGMELDITEHTKGKSWSILTGSLKERFVALYERSCALEKGILDESCFLYFDGKVKMNLLTEYEKKVLGEISVDINENLKEIQKMEQISIGEMIIKKEGFHELL